MSDLISREALMEFAKNHVGRTIDCNDIARFTAVDAEPVRHGKWVYGDDVDIQCSECGKDAMSDWMKYTQVYSPYCPWCGAKMDLK